MSWFQATRTRLRLLLRRDAADARIKKEFEFHIEMETERLVRDEKLDVAEARRRALVAFGGIETHKESLRDNRGLPWLNGLSLDLKLGLRMLVKYPGLTFVGVIGIAVAVGIGAVSFSGIYAIIDGKLPLDEGDRIIAIQNYDAHAANEGRRTHLHDLATWREGLKAVGELGAYRTVDRNLITPNNRPEPVRIAEMTATGFRIARVPPMVGRYFHDDDERVGAPPVVVIGYDVWQNRFAGRSDIVGQTVQLGDARHTIIGVMPDGFAFPINHRIWTPLQLNPSSFERGDAPPIEVFGRLATGATLADAEQQLKTIGQRLATEYPGSHQYVRPQIWPYARTFVESPELAWAFHLIQLMISMLLVVIGTNVAILVYARTASRAGEIAVRTALGASRARVVAQLFAEALVLSTLAAAVGVGAARIALRQIDGYFNAIAGEQRPFWWQFGITPGVILYAAGLAVLGAVIVGLLPGLRATRRNVHPTLQQHGLGGTALRLGKTWTFLIVAQVAVAVAALPMAIQGGRVWLKLQSANLTGGVATQVVAASLVLDRQDRPAPRVDGQRTVVGKIAQLGTTFGTVDADRDFAIRYENLRIELIRRLEAEPAVASVTVASAIPGNEPSIRMEVENGATTSADTSAPTAAGAQVAVSRVDPSFFGALDIPLLAGRAFGSTDASPEAPAVIVNRRFVQHLLGGRNPLGLRVRPVTRVRKGTPERNEPWQQIVGVVSDFPQAFDTTIGVQPRMYRAWTAGDGKPVTLIVRARGTDATDLRTRLRELTVGVHPMLRLGNIATIDETIRQGMAADSLMLLAAMLVTMSVLLLSAAGIYALTSFTITRRRREIGIRSALGAGPGRVLVGVLSRTAGQVGAGMAVGMALAALVVAASREFRMTGPDVLLLVAVAAIMAALGLAAAIGPARRALRIQPTEALKAE